VVKGLRNRRISEAMSRASRLGIPLRFESREILDRLAGGVPHQGLIAVVSAKPTTTLESLLSKVRDPGLVVVLDGVEDPRNLGAILRTVEAAGADGVLLPERHSAGLSETVSRASAGALEHVEVASIGNVAQALEELKARGYWIVGLDASGTERWDAVDYKKPIALVLGGEGKGMRRLVREHCDHLVSLPLFGQVTSLNVSVAAGIALYEVVRQRGAVPSHVRPIPPRPAAPPQVVGPGGDDAEHDPGARPHGGAPPEAGDDEGDEIDDGASPTLFADDDESPAWSGPQVVVHAPHQRARHGGDRPPREARRGRRDRGRPPRGRHGTPRERGENAPPRSDAEGPRSEGPAPGGPPGPPRRNRRRRRGRPGPGQDAGRGPGPVEGSGGGSPGRAEGGGGGSGADRGPENGPGGPPGDRPEGSAGPGEGGGRRRRRRRRRH
jgi:23S rRNA (guanosine2251-2'-O)-methyltransferase